MRRAALLRRLGWSLGAASLWTWGLLGVRMLRDGLQPLEVWFGYSLSFFMTAVYVYMGLLIAATLQAEGGLPRGGLFGPTWAARAARLWRPLALLGVVGLALALGSLGGWLALRYPGPQAASGTIASVILALMVFAVAALSTFLAREPEDRGSR